MIYRGNFYTQSAKLKTDLAADIRHCDYASKYLDIRYSMVIVWDIDPVVKDEILLKNHFTNL